jgi:hypothetical protein
MPLTIFSFNGVAEGAFGYSYVAFEQIVYNVSYKEVTSNFLGHYEYIGYKLGQW